jgi:Cys-rich repeat protein
VAAPDCGCSATAEKTCRLTLTACSADSDCPAGFTCEANPQTSCSVSSNGETSCEPPNPARVCAPPYTELVSGVGAGHGEDASGTPIPADDPQKSGNSAGEATSGANAEPASESASDGCSVARAPRPGAGAFGLGALAAFGALGVLGVRRQRARLRH